MATKTPEQIAIEANTAQLVKLTTVVGSLVTAIRVNTTAQSNVKANTTQNAALTKAIVALNDNVVALAGLMKSEQTETTLDGGGV